VTAPGDGLREQALQNEPRPFHAVPGSEVHDYSTGDLPAEGEPQWDRTAMQTEFSVHGFAAPFVVVTRKSDGVKGTLQFNHSPRIYFNFQPDAS
jgi:hypothetical protein